jgi:hypothetical protein
MTYSTVRKYRSKYMPLNRGNILSRVLYVGGDSRVSTMYHYQCVEVKQVIYYVPGNHSITGE